MSSKTRGTHGSSPALTPEATLGSIAAERPESIAVFERHGLDYCCGGGRSLAEACESRSLDPHEILAKIEAESSRPSEEPERSWGDATMTELADHIERTHHAFARDALARLGQTLPRVLEAHGQTHPELAEVKRVVDNLAEEMEDHLVREERVLFPWLRRLERPTEITSGPPWSVKRPISCMIHDHDDVGAAFSRLRELTGDYAVPDDACGTYRSVLETLGALERDTHVHIHKENNILFPAGVRAEEQRVSRTAAGA